MADGATSDGALAWHDPGGPALGTSRSPRLGSVRCRAAAARSSPVDRLCRATAATAPHPPPSPSPPRPCASMRPSAAMSSAATASSSASARWRRDVARDEDGGARRPLAAGDALLAEPRRPGGWSAPAPARAARGGDASAGGPATSCRSPTRSRACAAPPWRRPSARRWSSRPPRAAAVDIPWSAAFVSHVVLSAGVPRSRFAAAIAHLDYVAEAARRSAEEAEGRRRRASTGLRSPPHGPPARRPPLPPPARAGLAAGRGRLCRSQSPPSRGASARLEPALRHRRGARQPARAGDNHRGNVLSRWRSGSCGPIAAGRWAGPAPVPSCEAASRTGTLCRPEEAPWFVILQAVDPSDP